MGKEAVLSITVTFLMRGAGREQVVRLLPLPSQVPHMHHPHLITFIGADYLQKHGQLTHYLVTEYHKRGSLYQYLQETTLDVAAVVVLAQSAASGLAHLHLEVKGPAGEKPSIVHRNITSRSFFVKSDGE
jgi:serine/threonine protein kinase